MIGFFDVRVVFPGGKVALDGVTLEIEKGLFTVVVGPSGAGKTTLLRTVNGFVVPCNGRVIIDGIEVVQANYRRIRTRASMVFQHFNLINNLSAMKNVLSGSLGTHQKIWSNLFLFPKSLRIKALDLLDRVGLLDKAYNRADSLSGGEQQRVGIARAMMQEPRVLLVDEPIASVDPTNAKNILTLLRELCLEKGVTVLCSLHQVELALSYSDSIIGLSEGQLIFNEKTVNLNKKLLHQIYKTERGAKTPMEFKADEHTPTIEHIKL